MLRRSTNTHSLRFLRILFIDRSGCGCLYSARRQQIGLVVVFRIRGAAPRGIAGGIANVPVPRGLVTMAGRVDCHGVLDRNGWWKETVEAGRGFIVTACVSELMAIVLL